MALCLGYPADGDFLAADTSRPRSTVRLSTPSRRNLPSDSLRNPLKWKTRGWIGSRHGAGSGLDPAMVLLDEVVQVRAGDGPSEEAVLYGSGIAVQGDRVRQPTFRARSLSWLRPHPACC